MYKRAAEQSLLSLLQLCNSFSKLTQIHAKILKLGLQTNPIVLTKFTSVSSELNAICYACSLTFSQESKSLCYDTFLYNAVIKAYAETTHLKHTAIRYYKEMLSDRVEPNNYTYPFVLKACAGIGDLKLGKAVHGSVIKLGYCGDAHVLNSMINMYSSCENGILFAENLFDKMLDRNSVSWSTMMCGYVRQRMSNEAVKLFRRMQIARVKPDEISLVMVVSACADLGSLELGRWVESYIKKERIEMRVELHNTLIDMFAKCGDVDEALRLFHNMSESKKTIVSWTCIINGMALHGSGMQAVSLFEEMKESGVVPDDVVFVGLLCACSHSGLVEEGKRYFDMMVKDYGIEPRIEHYGCMVDMLTRAGLVKEAMEFIDRMPMAPNAVILRSVIAHGELNLGERMSKDLIMNEPLEEANYVLLCSIYAQMSDWEKKSLVREDMGKKGIRKVPGNTSIEL